MRVHDPGVVQQRLDLARRNLLDTSLRNRLISFRAQTKGGKPIERVVQLSGESPVELYRLLVIEGRTMTFEGRPDEPTKVDVPQQAELYDFGRPEDLRELRKDAEAELADYLGHAVLPTDPLDLKLSVDEPKARLHGRLLKIWRDAQVAIEEQGVNVLFLALGLLEWYEADGSDERRFAPLVLIPVTLEKTNAGRFKVRHDGSEVGENLSIGAKLQSEFGIRMPVIAEDEIDLGGYFAAVRHAIGVKARWGVVDSAGALGFFSYAKYLMYRDLDASTWPDERKPRDHEILGALLDCGFEDEGEGISEDEFLDPLRPVEAMNEVTEVDSSQALAIMEAAAGRTMLIEGPPGTGKSQTITNLIAEAIAGGKKVLFVAEKMAALDVVQRRLAEAGLADACLELHSNKANKKEFYEDLKRTVAQAAPALARIESELQRLTVDRDTLNAYCHAINDPLPVRGISPRTAMGRLVALGEEASPDGRQASSAMVGWSEADFRAKLDLVRKLEARVALMGSPHENPFYGSRLSSLFPEDRLDILRAIEAATAAVETLRERGAKLAERLRVPEARNVGDALVLCNCAKRAIAAPRLDDIAIKTQEWCDGAAKLREAFARGRERSALRGKHSSDLTDGAWTADVSAARSSVAQHGPKWYRLLVSEYREAQRQLRALTARPIGPLGDQLALLDAIQSCQAADAILTDIAPVAKSLYGVQWQGDLSDWDSLERLLDWIQDLHAAAASGEVPAGFLDFFSGRHESVGLANESMEVVADARAAVMAIHELLKLVKMPVDECPSAAGTFTEQLTMCAKWRSRIEGLFELVQFNLIADEARAAGLEPSVVLAQNWPLAGSQLAESFERSWYTGVLREAFAARPALARFDSTAHEHTIKDFRELDRLVLRHNRAKVARAHWNRVPRQASLGALGWLQRQFELSRRHRPIRVAMSKAGEAVQAIKPVFMMSPLSVAMYLPPDGPRFDLVIFDEASQVKPEDSFGAILRARQAIVVGDTKQMPPTSFFDKLTCDLPDEEELDEDSADIRDLESVLGLMSSVVGELSHRRRRLKWHYRSHHDSLIATSNRLFYRDTLVTFPNPEAPGSNLGLTVRRVPNASYGRGTTRKNVEEARAVVQAAIEHVTNCPELSLGIAAFSGAQQEAIQDELEIASRNEPAFEAFENRHPFERLFVKNLENVQGDERDVVFISVGYGADDAGFASMNFGPLNRAGGERRLNVLITRARIRCEVFTNLKSDDIRLGESGGAGLAALKTFLHFAETGNLDRPATTGKLPQSPFEEAVIEALASKGFQIEPQVGSIGFFIDLAVRHPDRPNQFVLGIECDGAMYHSAKSCRDRDRLRQSALESRGWRIHRIWSTDWWRDSTKELRKTIEAIDSAIAGTQTPQQHQREAEPAYERETETVSVPALIGDAYKKIHFAINLNGLPLHEVDPPTMASWVGAVVRREGPVHVEEVIRRIREAAGLKQSGSRIQDAIRNGIDCWLRTGEGTQLGCFLYPTANGPLLPRNRSGLPGKRIDFVAPEEVDAAVLTVLRASFGLSVEDACTAAARILGFQGLKGPSRDYVLSSITRLRTAGALVGANGTIKCADSILER